MASASGGSDPQRGGAHDDSTRAQETRPIRRRSRPTTVGTSLRSPSRPLVIIPQTLSEITGPVYGHSDVQPEEADLTTQHAGEPLGERIIVRAACSTRPAAPCRNTLIEIWQCNAAGRYIHQVDQHPAPLDPNFTGAGRVVTDADGNYQFITIKPGAYPWGNHPNAWRPAHIHFSLFGPSFLTRLVTQMYFPGDPLFPFDPIFNSVTDAKARERMICRFDMETTKPEWALGYIFDIVLRGPAATPDATNDQDLQNMPERTPSQTVGPYLHIGLTQGVSACREIFGPAVADAGVPGSHIRIEGRVLDGNGNVMPDAMMEIWQADAEGRYAHPADGRPPASNSFRGFGRCATAKDGGFSFATVKPGACRAPTAAAAGAAHQCGRVRARHAQAAVHAHLLRGRSGQRAATRSWPWCRPSGATRCWPSPIPSQPNVWRFDIRLQGAPTRRCSSTR